MAFIEKYPDGEVAYNWHRYGARIPQRECFSYYLYRGDIWGAIIIAEVDERKMLKELLFPE
jgi:hypothetical protein